METLEALKRKTDTAQDLLAIVKTMKALSAVSIRQYERVLGALDAYSRTVDTGLQAVLKDHPEACSLSGRPGQQVALVVGSDQGLCGSFNEQVSAYALNDLALRGEAPILLAVGARAGARLEEAGTAAAEVFSLPSSAARIATLVQDILLSLDALGASVVRLYHNESSTGAAYKPRQQRLLPVDTVYLQDLIAAPWPSRVLPSYSLDWEALFTSLLREHLFVSLHRALAASLASEYASRLVAMQAAEKNIGERLSAFRGQYNQLRQTAVTAELLDIVSGFEVLTGQEPSL